MPALTIPTVEPAVPSFRCAFFSEVGAADAFAGPDMRLSSPSRSSSRHAYSGWIFAADHFAPSRRFHGCAAPSSRPLFKVQFLLSWVDLLVDEQQLGRKASWYARAG